MIGLLPSHPTGQQSARPPTIGGPHHFKSGVLLRGSRPRAPDEFPFKYRISSSRVSKSVIFSAHSKNDQHIRLPESGSGLLNLGTKPSMNAKLTHRPLSEAEKINEPANSPREQSTDANDTAADFRYAVLEPSYTLSERTPTTVIERNA